MARGRRPVTLNAQALGGLVWLGVGAFLLWAGRDLGIGSIVDPGSGFLVFWGGALILLFAAMILVEAAREPGERLGDLWRGTRWGRVLTVIGALLAYGALLGTLGFVLATLPLLLLLLRAVDPVRWRLALPIAVGATLGVWWVVQRLLLIQLPRGVLELG